MTRAHFTGALPETLVGLARALRPEARSILDLAPGDGELALHLLEACRGARYLGLFPDAESRDAALRRLHGFEPAPAGRVGERPLDEAWGKRYDLLLCAEPFRASSESDLELLGRKIHESLIEGGACLLAALARLPEGPVAQAVRRFEGGREPSSLADVPAGADLVYWIRRAGFRQAEIVFRRGTRILLAAVR